MVTKKEIKLTGPTGELARYLSAPYVRMIIPNTEEGGYLAEVLELPGCITEGDTLEEAYQNLEDAMAGWIETSLEDNRPIPEPVGDKEYSGHFPLRMSTELHRAAALRAMQEGISLNHWIVGAIAAQVTSQNLVEDLADQVASMRQLLAEVIGRIPVRVSAGGFLVSFSSTGIDALTPPHVAQGRMTPSEASSAATTPHDVIFAAVGRQVRAAIANAGRTEKEVKQNA